MPSRHIMVDIETLSLQSNAAVVAIAAAEFDPFNPQPPEALNTFYVQCNDYDDQQRNYGRHISGGTLKWWLQQPEQVRVQLISNESSHRTGEAVRRFVNWLRAKDHDAMYLWAKPASFDFPILEGLFKAYLGFSPWDRHSLMCAQTLLALSPFAQTKPDVAHFALHDAIAQAYNVRAVIQKLGLTEAHFRTVPALKDNSCATYRAL